MGRKDHTKVNSSSSDLKIKPAVTALALLITEQNATAVVGWPFRYCRETAQRLGVPILRASAHKSAIRADLFLAALEKANVPVNGTCDKRPEVVVDCADPAEAVRQMLGKRRANR